jgi:phosphatidyl-myo-inositol alpha-mannosyltransferase
VAGGCAEEGKAVKVALVCPYAWDRDGGVQSHVRSLALTLRARDHDVAVLAPLANPSRRGPDGLGIDIRVTGRTVPIPANGSVAPLSFGPRAAARVSGALRRFVPDVVHVHEPLVPSVSLLALYGKVSPAVGTFHAAADSSFGYAAARPVLRHALDRLAVRTAVSDAARRLIERYFPGDYLLTPNGVDAAAFGAAEPIDLGPGKKVLFLGRVERRKGLEVLIQAATRLRDLDVELIVAGGGPREGRCRALARQLEVPARFLGRVSDGDVRRLYRSADAFCAPGLGGESFGIVLLEAMAAGAPLVCSDVPGFRAVAEGAAEIVPPGDPGRLAAALRRVLTDDGARAALRASGLRRASMYDWKRLAAGVEAAYERAAG